MVTKQEFTKIMAVMTLAYPNYQLRLGTEKIYFEILRDLPVEILEAASKQLMAESKFFPSVAEWRTRSLEIMNAKSSQPTAFEAWGIVQDEIKRIGSYGQPVFDNPDIERTVRAIGWRELCLSEDVMVLRAHFSKCYDQIVTRRNEEARLLPEVRQTAENYRIAAGVDTLVKKLSAGG